MICMLGVNKVILVGYVGQDPAIRYLENGRTQATFSLATHDAYKNKEGQKYAPQSGIVSSFGRLWQKSRSIMSQRGSKFI